MGVDGTSVEARGPIVVSVDEMALLGRGRAPVGVPFAADTHTGAPVVEAYVLVETEIGKMGQVNEALIDIPGVIAADVLSGPYDVIARIEAPDFDGLGRLVISKIQAVEGVTRTLTCPVVQL